MKVVIDTNVLISAILRDRTPETVILFVAERPDFEWVVTREILAEYKAVLARNKFGLPQEILREWFETLDECTIVIDAHGDISFPRDEKDAKFLSCALIAGAAFLVTGDHDFGEAEKLITTTIVSVSMFNRLVVENWTDSEASERP